jgi:predicted nucleic acid-binding protein
MPVVRRSTSTPVFFLDTNILVYSFSEQDVAKREIARSLVEADGARISTQVLSELAHVLTRKFALPAREVKERIAGVTAGCEVVVVSPAVVLDALRVMEQYGYGFFDSQIIATALACGASVLHSEDLHDGQTIDARLRIRSPFRIRAEQRSKPYRVGKSRARAGPSQRRG